MHNTARLTRIGDRDESEICQTRSLPWSTHGHQCSDDDCWPKADLFLDGFGLLLYGNGVGVWPKADEETFWCLDCWGEAC